MAPGWKFVGGKKSYRNSLLGGDGFGGNDNMFRFRITIDMSFRFRFALILCAFIILVNILFKVQTDNVEMAIYKQSKAVLYRSRHQVARDRPNPDTDDDYYSEDLRMDIRNSERNPVNNAKVKHKDSEETRRFPKSGTVVKKQMNDDRLKAVNHAVEPGQKNVHNGESDEVERVVEGLCHSGHIAGLSPICDKSGCLRRLSPDPSVVRKPLVNSVPDSVRRRINYIPGWIDSAHYSLVPLLTEMQWEASIYGTVGEIVAGIGKFTTLLTYNVDHSSGEMIFVADDFFSSSVKYHSDDAASLYDTFVDHVTQCGYTVTDISSVNSDLYSSSDVKTVYVYRGNILDLDKRTLSTWNFPQFRLVSIESDSDKNSVMTVSSLMTASCLLRSGGLLVIDGIDSLDSSEHVIGSLSHYFKDVQGENAVVIPLLSARNKLYLTTVDYKSRYSDYLLVHLKQRLKLTVNEVTTSVYGRKFTYLYLP